MTQALSPCCDLAIILALTLALSLATVIVCVHIINLTITWRIHQLILIIVAYLHLITRSVL